jgi:CrcB protein
MKFWWPLCLVGAGSTLGGGSRVALGLFLHNMWSDSLLLSALVVNLLGSFFIGLLAARMGVFLHEGRVSKWWLFWGSGFCGGFTTFSFFSWETLLLWQAGAHLAVAMSVAGTAVGAVFLAAAGYRLGGGQ